MFKKIKELVENYFQSNKKVDSDINSDIISYPMIHISISDKNKNLSWNLDFQYNVKTKNRENVKIQNDLIAGYIGTNIIADIDRIDIGNVRYNIYIKEYIFNRSQFNRSELLPCIFEATSKYAHFPANNPKYPESVRIINGLYHQCLYYPKFIDDLDYDYYKADEILEVTLNESIDYSSSTKFGDMYFNDKEFLKYGEILRRTLPHEYIMEIFNIIKKGK